MVQTPKSNLCLWLVPGGDGRVRKIRLTKGRGLLISFGLVLVFGIVGLMSADYTRVQLLRLKSALSAKRLAAEKAYLAGENASLEAEVESLKVLNDKVMTHQRSVRQRLDELKSILSFTTSLGIVESDLPQEARSYHPEDGVGGAEIDCDASANPLCTRPGFAEGMSLPDPDRATDMELGEVLDRYIEVIRGLPLLVPADGYVTSDFGFRRSPFSGKSRMHAGMDFSLSSGAEVFASGDGVVESVKRTSTYGLVVDIDHGRGVVTRYAHLSKAFVTEGEKICTGEVLALAGSTGRSTGPHLHYEVLVSGKPVNPMRFFSIAKSLEAFLT